MNAAHGEDSIVESVSGISNAKGTPSAGEVLTNGPFLLLFAAQFTQNIGAAVSWLALQFFIFKLTESPGMMGILSIIFWTPYVLFTPFAGVVVDRFDQRKIMLFSNLLSFLASVGYIIVYMMRESLIVLININGLNVYSVRYILVLLFILTFINSSAASIFFPARSAYTRLIVKKKNLLVANSVGSTVFQIATIFGFVFAGLLAARSYLLSFIVDAATFAVSGLLIGVIFFIGKKPPAVERDKSKNLRMEMKGIGEDLAIGYRTIREYPKISYMLIIFSLLTFSFGAINVLFIVILQGEMGLGQTWYGVLQALMGASGIITAIVLMSIGKINRKILLLNITFTGVTISMYIFAVVRNPWVIAVILFSYGIMNVCINVPASTLIQESIPYEKQGRVFGTQQLVQGIAQLIGMGVVSMIAEYVLPMWVLLASSGLLTITIIFGFIYSGKRNLMSSDYLEDEEINGKIAEEKFISEELSSTAESSIKAKIEEVPGK